MSSSTPVPSSLTANPIGVALTTVDPSWFDVGVELLLAAVAKEAANLPRVLPADQQRTRDAWAAWRSERASVA